MNAIYGFAAFDIYKKYAPKQWVFYDTLGQAWTNSDRYAFSEFAAFDAY